MKWYNIAERLEKKMTFNITFGGRGIGKTYSTLDYIITNKVKFIYLRNQQNEIDISCTNECNPFKTINTDKGYNYHFNKISKEIVGVYDGNENLTGYGIALNTFAKLRGVDFSDVELIFFEEFNTSLRISNKQGELFANLYETVNRNRELKGKEPVKVIMCGNALTIANPIMNMLNIVTAAEQMIKNGEEIRVFEDRGILLEIVSKSVKPLTESKSDTALYKALKDTDYYKHAIDNEFINDSFYNVCKQNVSEYKPLCSINDIYILTHKSNGTIFCTDRNVGKFNVKYSIDTKSKFIKDYGFFLRLAYLDKKIFFKDYNVKVKILSLLDL